MPFRVIPRTSFRAATPNSVPHERRNWMKGSDSNRRAASGPDLQSGGFSHSPTLPSSGGAATRLPTERPTARRGVVYRGVTAFSPSTPLLDPCRAVRAMRWHALSLHAPGDQPRRPLLGFSSPANRTGRAAGRIGYRPELTLRARHSGPWEGTASCSGWPGTRTQGRVLPRRRSPPILPPTRPGVQSM